MHAGYWKKILFSLFTLFLLLGVAELALRITSWQAETIAVDRFSEDALQHGHNWELDELLFWRLKPDSAVDYMGATYRVNADGFRGEPGTHIPSGKRPENKTRVVVLGDSVSFGLNVLNDNEVYAAVLQRHLGEGYEVINLAVPGYTSYQGRLLLKKYAFLQPDIVIVGFGWNDGLSTNIPDRKRKSFARISQLTTVRKAALNLHLLSFLREIIFWRGQAQRHRVPLDDYRDNLIELARMDPPHKTAFIVQPDTGSTDAREREENNMTVHPRYNEVVRGLSAYGLVVDVDAVFHQCGERCGEAAYIATVLPDGSHLTDPIHPNRYGHRWIAAALYDALKRSGWVL
ncbi:MAG TPA: GDSL-type esterase/lipase family protein [bacterium]|nr:GDSL-type esterase/lipase family protein [bacterium]